MCGQTLETAKIVCLGAGGHRLAEPAGGDGREKSNILLVDSKAWCTRAAPISMASRRAMRVRRNCARWMKTMNRGRCVRRRVEGTQPGEPGDGGIDGGESRHLRTHKSRARNPAGKTMAVRGDLVMTTSRSGQLSEPRSTTCWALLSSSAARPRTEITQAMLIAAVHALAELARANRSPRRC